MLPNPKNFFITFIDWQKCFYDNWNTYRQFELKKFFKYWKKILHRWDVKCIAEFINTSIDFLVLKFYEIIITSQKLTYFFLDKWLDFWKLSLKVHTYFWDSPLAFHFYETLIWAKSKTQNLSKIWYFINQWRFSFKKFKQDKLFSHLGFQKYFFYCLLKKQKLLEHLIFQKFSGMKFCICSSPSSNFLSMFLQLQVCS